jgi:hypothetical protein
VLMLVSVRFFTRGASGAVSVSLYSSVCGLVSSQHTIFVCFLSQAKLLNLVISTFKYLYFAYNLPLLICPTHD